MFGKALGLGLLAATAATAGAAPVKDRHVEAELVANVTAVEPGQEFLLGLRLEHDPKWHTYWKSTQTGFGPSLELTLPEGIEAGETQWPAPEVYETGGLVDFVYDDEVVLPIPAKASSDLQPGQTLTLKGTADWLMCADVCIPGAAELTLKLPVVAAEESTPSQASGLFQQMQPRMPTADLPWTLDADIRDGEVLELVLSPSDSLSHAPGALHFFSDQALTSYLPTQDWTERDGTYTTTLPLSDYANLAELERITGVITASEGFVPDGDKRALLVDVPLAGEQVVAATAGTSGTTGDAGVAPAAPSAIGLAEILGLALIGGLILNLMPCVFPVIGIKIMGFVSQAGEERGRIILHGLTFAAGVVLSFWVLAGAFVALKAAGEGIGWGFQLQSPVFVYILAAFILLFALNMSGVFELGQKLVGTGQSLQSKGGLGGSFFSGVLATVVATPCSAPFLGTALGAAIVRPASEIFLIFSVVGVGLALPYLILSLFPGLVRYLPRPGAWMETFKQAMSFLLYGTVAYLVWVLAAQLGDEDLYGGNALLNSMLALVLISVAAWIYGRWTAPHRKSKVRLTGFATSLVILAVAFAFGLPRLDKVALERRQMAASTTPEAVGAVAPAVVEGSNRVFWEKWAPGKAEELAAQGWPVYVDFTARWCVTCQTNKRTVFSSDEVLETFRDRKVVALKADWTNRDPLITAELAKYEKAAVPFNVVYLPGQEPVELPALLTPGIVLNALEGEPLGGSQAESAQAQTAAPADQAPQGA